MKTTSAPTRGPLFQAAARVPVEGARRRKLLVLLAAFADAGEHSPAAVELRHRVGLGDSKGDVRKLDGLLDRLVEDGLLEVEWAGRGGPGRRRGRWGKRNRYRVLVTESAERRA